MGPRQLYLVAYNAVQCAAWSCVLYQLVLHHLEQPVLAAGGAYAKTSQLLLICQNAAVLEVIHSLIGLVRGAWLTTAIQVASRVLVLMVAVYPHVEAQESIFYSTMVLCWSVTEVVRYAFYALNEFKACPYFLTWLRYSLFIILYPAGIISEIGCIVTVLPIVKEQNFNVWVFLIVCLVAYIPGSPTMIGHMLKRRKSALREDKKSQASAGAVRKQRRKVD